MNKCILLCQCSSPTPFRYVFEKAPPDTVQFFVDSEIVGISEAVATDMLRTAPLPPPGPRLCSPAEKAISADIPRVGPLADSLHDYERQIIVTALEQNQNHLNRTAAQLKITRHALRYRMQRLNLDIGAFGDDDTDTLPPEEARA